MPTQLYYLTFKQLTITITTFIPTSNNRTAFLFFISYFFFLIYLFINLFTYLLYSTTYAYFIYIDLHFTLIYDCNL